MPMLLAIILLLVSGAVNGGEKPNTLVVLEMLPLTGMGPKPYASSCRASSQLAVEIVNNRTDILPNYRIEMQFEDERLGTLAASIVANYTRSFEQNRRVGYFQSPIILGPLFSNGCAAIGPFLHHINSVGISTGCRSQSLTDRVTNPNLFLTMAGNYIEAMGEAHFVTDVGRWRNVGIISNANNVNDYTMALEVQRLIVGNKVSVPVFEIALDISDDTILRLKSSDVRIVVVITAATSMVWQFYCYAYRNGMSGPRYVIIANTVVFVQPDALTDVSPRCTRSMILEQYKSTVWIGSQPWSIDRTSKSQFGYDSIQFDAMLNARNADLVASPDYMARYTCHDAILRAAISLDNAEKQLLKKNLTLKDYYTNSNDIMMIVNQSVLTSGGRGLRIPELKYSSRGQVDNEQVVVMVWSKSSMNAMPIFTQQFNGSAGGYGFSSYWLKSERSFSFESWLGATPKDAPTFEKFITTTSENLHIAIIVLSSFGGGIAIVGLVITIYLRKRDFVFLNFLRSKLLAYFGAIFMSVAQIAFVYKLDQLNFSLASTKLCLLVIGASFVHGVITFRCVAFTQVQRQRISEERQGKDSFVASSRNRSRSNTWEDRKRQSRLSSQANQHHQQLSPEVLSKIDKVSFGATVAFVALNAVLLMIWLVADSMSCYVQLIYDGVVYNEITDTVTESSVIVCESKHHLIFALAITCLHVGMLAYGALVCLRQQRQFLKHSEFTAMVVPVVNSLAIICASCLILVIIRNQINQQSVIAMASFITATVCSVTMLYPLVKKLID